MTAPKNDCLGYVRILLLAERIDSTSYKSRPKKAKNTTAPEVLFERGLHLTALRVILTFSPLFTLQASKMSRLKNGPKHYSIRSTLREEYALTALRVISVDQVYVRLRDVG